MILDLSDGMLRIEDSPPRLGASQQSQLRFWGFNRLPKSTTYTLSSERIADVLPKLCDYLDRQRVSYCLSRACGTYLETLQASVGHVKQIQALAKDFKEGQFNKDDFDVFCRLLEQYVTRPLKDHQLKAAYHLSLVGHGANFSVPGSGKTAVILIVYEKLRREGKVNTLYVIGPPACFGPWQAEYLLTLGRVPDSRVLAGGDPEERKSEYYAPISEKGELYLTTFQTLMNDRDDLLAFLNRRGNKTFLVIDEAHYIKQIGGSWSAAILRISENAEYRCVLTGTPMPMSYTDVFNLFDFLWPHKSPLDSRTKVRIKLHEEKNEIHAATGILKESIGSLFYRVRKCDLGLIPPVFNSPCLIAMNRHEEQVYQAIEGKIAEYARRDFLINIDLVNRLRRGRIIRLRQCVSYVGLLLTALDSYQEDLVDEKSELAGIIRDYDDLEVPAKLEHLIRLVDDLHARGQKVVIWSHFVGTLHLIVRHLTSAGLRCKLIYGGTPIEQASVDEEETRERIRLEFIDPDSGLDVLVANPAACGESISLHKTCYHAVYYDLSYNCAQYLQSLDRIHRVGGSELNQANYYFLQYDNTIDQDIRRNLENKAARMQALVDEDYSIYSLDMSEQDEDVQAYERLFRVNKS